MDEPFMRVMSRTITRTMRCEGSCGSGTRGYEPHFGPASAINWASVFLSLHPQLGGACLAHAVHSRRFEASVFLAPLNLVPDENRKRGQGAHHVNGRHG